jgi:hypothetical protein
MAPAGRPAPPAPTVSRDDDHGRGPPWFYPPCTTAMAWTPRGRDARWRLLVNAGGIPGFLSIVLSTPDGRRQLGLMIKALLASAPVYEAFVQGSRALGRRLLS